ncbi:AAA family ATPase [Adlercreutzia equolifaciens]|uniref:AAA family ATPase n=1 Tax=Adlercreutzia equolifaciens TaxID=446660 RepID=UPI0023B11739|nr:AAA family ATPase [Adlercreutzia equolifaciens]MDE8701800.1 AAA family ATPase [Adlercreutzia equolifaciens]
MKKSNVVNLIQYHVEHNNRAFMDEAFEIARDFDQNGDSNLAGYIMSLLSSSGAFTTQAYEADFDYLVKTSTSNRPLPLPDSIFEDVRGIINAASRDVGINKFLFKGRPGSGKTETAKQIARLMNRELLSVDFNAVIDSKLGQTSKNISSLFKEIARLSNQNNYVLLFDEIDALILDRVNSSDLREMGRATSTFLRELDDMGSRVVLIATTNLYDYFDKAVLRRFDFVVDFDRYAHKDLCDVAETILEQMLSKFEVRGRNARLFRKILSRSDSLPYPAELENIIKTSVAFSSPSIEGDYLRRLYVALVKNPTDNIQELKTQGFTLKEIEILTDTSKSSVARKLEDANVK